MSRRPKTHERGGPRHRRRRQPQMESTADLRAPDFDDPDDEAAFWEAEGRRCAIEGMDLPDGAYLAMMDEAGLDPC
jgi:hypothetical protein